MLKALWCWIVGWPCRWRHDAVLNTKMRFANGIYINCKTPVVQDTVCQQVCDRCGATRRRTITTEVE